ncbi:carbohydrate kinase family protein [Nocardioidaceae bacterium SCSIO 66511]|nr:carbohydrate kinase family protein [Nocardioidaceae bacterium SCSIO 66511]
MSTSLSRLVFVGAATFDAIALVPEFPAGDQRTIADDFEVAGGGPAATAAVAAARLGQTSQFVGAVGADAEGDRVLAWLDDEGVDTECVERTTTRRTGASVILVHARDRVRAIATRPVAPLEIGADSPAAEAIRTADWVHVDHIGWPAIRGLVNPSANSAPRVSVDAGNPIDAFTPTGVALHVPTVESLRRTYGALDVPALLDRALSDGAHTVVATNGAEGCFAASQGGEQASADGHQIDVVSTLGAGDVFHGALLAATVRGLPLEQRLAYANVAAALSCRALDGRSAIPDHDTVVTALRSDNDARYETE